MSTIPIRKLRKTTVLDPSAKVAVLQNGIEYQADVSLLKGQVQSALTSGVWYSVPSFCTITLTGSGPYSYDLKDQAGVITSNVGSGNAPESGPLYVGNSQVRFNFPENVSAKVN